MKGLLAHKARVGWLMARATSTEECNFGAVLISKVHDYISCEQRSGHCLAVVTSVGLIES